MPSGDFFAANLAQAWAFKPGGCHLACTSVPGYGRACQETEDLWRCQVAESASLIMIQYVALWLTTTMSRNTATKVTKSRGPARAEFSQQYRWRLFKQIMLFGDETIANFPV